MGLTQTLFGGSSTKYMNLPQDPKLTGWIDQAHDYNPKMDKSGKAYKQLWKDYQSDPLKLAGAALSQGALNDRSIKDDYMTGGNALIANAGGDQAQLMQRMKEIALAKNQEQTGVNAMGEAERMGQMGLAGWGAKQDTRNAQKYGMQQFAIGARQGYNQYLHPLATSSTPGVLGMMREAGKTLSTAMGGG